ncbi:hypothetical protein ISS42_01815 [Candidatus Shapirobacteria bacterium]|nr:hypothetical protein [Candidatus Shapirobacteria bacterium]
MNDKSKLNWLDQGTFEITAKIAKEEIKKEYQISLKTLAQSLTLPGFRKGKSPLAQVEKKLGKEAIYQELIKKFIPQIYQKALTEHQLKPIAEPKVVLTSAQENKDWEIKITSCVLPEINLLNYKEEIKKINAQGKIWTPGKETKEQKKLSALITKLIEVVKFKLPLFLIESEQQKRLVSLIDQLQKTGLTIDQYLTTKKQTLEQLKAEINKQIESDWKLELILEKVADQEKIEVKKEEIEKAIASVKGEEKQKVNPYLLARFLRRQKTLEFLLNL